MRYFGFIQLRALVELAFQETKQAVWTWVLEQGCLGKTIATKNNNLGEKGNTTRDSENHRVECGAGSGADSPIIIEK